MLSTFSTPLLIIALMLALLFWKSALRALERAKSAAQATCKSQGVQLLDSTVSLQSIRLARSTSGRVTLQRNYRFEYSADGVERQQGFIIVSGQQVESIGLAPEASAV
ncbi:hypothetical protein BOW53_11610 [Solemya pervernicosa gill symbiont]|uniref:DUF3301 domain-containing protein n=2 Tax=Gammaproteobacteria incertae sedis TaxID=118884 RepID=A0A1T2L2Y5_9GAMM|nr:DUF3301 domain-containing protein [Candidatus Reidiella endopervernicosa]OOZ39453.1 hypothetical protein BOW53_11610 [Solemya pervernicosa gill symbiont]QKQ26696.1 DUF3301 domain-containing protein [Candidatus Reidiella endopervernicosa]